MGLQWVILNATVAIRGNRNGPPFDWPEKPESFRVHLSEEVLMRIIGKSFLLHYGAVMFGYSFIIIIYYDPYDNLVTKWL